MKVVGFLLLACCTAQVALGINAEGKLDAEAKRALREMKIGDADVSDTDVRRESLARSLRQFILLLRLQAADQPVTGPVAAPADLDAISALTKDRLKNPGLPKLLVDDLPIELARALKTAHLVDDNKTEVTPAQMVAWLLNRQVMLELQAELDKSHGSSRDFWRKLDAASEKLMVAYNGVLRRAKMRG